MNLKQDRQLLRANRSNQDNPKEVFQGFLHETILMMLTRENVAQIRLKESSNQKLFTIDFEEEEKKSTSFKRFQKSELTI